MKDHLGRPLVAVTGIGIVTPLAWGREANWDALRAGTSGISRIRRFPIDKLRTTIAGTVELPEEAAGGPVASSPERVERMAFQHDVQDPARGEDYGLQAQPPGLDPRQIEQIVH